MPKLWNETVASHRQEVREAILDAAGHLVMSRGLLAVTMSQLAESTGIGRATLYKYFHDVEDVLAAWHERHVAGHLAELATIAADPGDPATRLRRVLRAYAYICVERRRHGGDAIAEALHRHQDRAGMHERELRELLSVLIAEAGREAGGLIRSDVPPTELADYCLHALAAAGSIGSSAAVARLEKVVWAGVTSSG